MANWVNGYFTGIDYISEFYGQYAPSNIEAVRLFQRQSRITSRPAFRHFELGCGHGLTSIILAACYPEASFTANDFLPQHVASARALAKKLGLSNVTFIEASFDELNQQNYQPFDYILSHGVYTWVAENSKQAIREFVAENLASTGVFSLSYNCKAGWAELDNLVEIFRVFATQHADHQIEPDHSPTLEKIKALFRKNRGFFKANGRAAEYLRQLIDDEVDPKYLFHEFAHQSWRSLYATEVMTDMSGINLGFAGSANLIDNFDELALDADLLDAVQPIKSLASRHSVKDLMLNTTLRTDIYSADVQVISMDECLDKYGDQIFILLKDPALWEFDAPLGEHKQISLDKERHGRLLSVVKEGGKSLRELCAFGAQLDLSPQQMLEHLVVLIALEYLGFAANQRPDFEYFTQLNSKLATLSLAGHRELKYLISPHTRTTVNADRADLLFYACGIPDDAYQLAECALEYCYANQVALHGPKGQILEGAVLKSSIRVQAREFVQKKVPSYRYLGLVPAG